MQTRAACAFLAISALACNPKDTGTADSGTDGDDTAADTGDTDASPVWEDLRLETSDTLTAGYSSGAGFYVVTDNGAAWLRQGGDWFAIDIDTGEESLNGVWGMGSGESLQMAAVGDAGTVATWASGGWSVEDIGTPNLESVSGAAPDNLIAVGWGGVYANATGSWEFQSIDGNPKFNHAWYDGNIAFAVGEDGIIGVMNNGKWTTSEHESRRRMYGVSGSSPSNVWAVGERGTVLHYDGSSWTLDEDVPTEMSLWSVHAFSPTAVYAVGNNGTALLYDGTEWSELPTGVDNVLYNVTASDTGTVWAVGNRGMTLRYTP